MTVTTKRQDRLRAAVSFLSAGNSELEPDERQNQGSRNADRQGRAGGEVGGRNPLFTGGLQLGERDVRRRLQQDDQVSGVGLGVRARPHPAVAAQ
jgi:hypothetical protein